MQILRPDPHHPIRKRLWQASLAAALVVLVCVIHETKVRLIDGSHTLSLGQDFLPVYAAGTLVREGRSAELYSIDPIAQIERRVVVEADLEPLPIYGPFLNPPFFAAMYAPLSALPYRQAAATWLAINLLLLMLSTILLCQMLPRGADWRTRALVPLLIVLPLPFWQAICHQQNTFLSLFLLCVVVRLCRTPLTSPAPADLPAGEGRAEGKPRASLPISIANRDSTVFDPEALFEPEPQSRRQTRRELAEVKSQIASRWASGAILALLFYKPQLACSISLVLVEICGWPALLGLCCTGLLLLLCGALLMPGALTAYLHHLSSTVALIQNRLAYNWGRQVTPQSFWRLLVQGHAAGPTQLLPKLLALISMAVIGVLLAAAAWRFVRGTREPRSRDRLIAATIACTPLLVPYFMDYDLLLLAIPAVLFARDVLQTGKPPTRRERLLAAAWAILFILLYATPALAGHTRFNLAPPLIALVAGLHVWLCLSPEAVSRTAQDNDAKLRLAA